MAGMMNSIRLLAYIYALTAELSEAQQNDSVAHCGVMTPNIRNLLEGEAFYHVPSFMADVKATEDQFTWRRNNVVVSSNESERIHVHGLAIYLLNVTPADAAIYTFQYTQSPEKCFTADLTVTVFNESFRLEKVMCYGSVESPSQSTRIVCPDPVLKTCQDTSGVITWYKPTSASPGVTQYHDQCYNSTGICVTRHLRRRKPFSCLSNIPTCRLQNMGLIEHEHKQDIRVQKLPQNNAVYTCMCTWAHNHRLYNSSGSRLLTLKDLSINSLEFLSPSDTNKEQFADAGSPTSLNCSVFCGINTGKHCTAEWRVNGSRVDNGKDYVQDNSIVNTPHNNTMATAVLTIRKVSAKDFQTNFTCVAKNNFKIQSKYLTLKPRESIIPVVTGYLFMLLLCIAVAILIKLFLVDLVLFFRPYFLCRSSKDVTKVYDAYVIYQSQSETKDIEYLLSEFISRSLPSVLEAQCGYKLFIQGRDDTPGEDRLELVEKRMKCSRRLMIILTPASSFSSTDCELASARELAFAGFDWQVGIHHVLVQREMSVILVQLGDTDQEYSHLPAGLQHLIRKSTPIKWPEKLKNASKANSRFWKKVRYLMPARPVANHLRLAPI